MSRLDTASTRQLDRWVTRAATCATIGKLFSDACDSIGGCAGDATRVVELSPWGRSTALA
jgi:hypothetical protein